MTLSPLSLRLLVLFSLVFSLLVAPVVADQNARESFNGRNFSLYNWWEINATGNIYVNGQAVQTTASNGSGNVSGGGTLNTFALWTTGGLLGDARMTQNATHILTGDDLDVTSGDLLVNGATRLTSGGILRVGNGLVGTPSMSFTSDTNVGFYRVAADQLGGSVGGSLIWLLHGLGVNVTGNVSASTFLGDLVGDVTGNADTATVLAANGANCVAGSAPLGVDASGAAESCTDFEEDLANEAGLYAALSDVSEFIENGDTAGGDLGGTFPNPTVDDDSHTHALGNLTGTTTTQCTGNDKLINITLANGVITGVCGTDNNTGGGGSGSMSGFVLTADSGSNQDINDSDTLDIQGDAGITTEVLATDTVNISVNAATCNTATEQSVFNGTDFECITDATGGGAFNLNITSNGASEIVITDAEILDFLDTGIATVSTSGNSVTVDATEAQTLWYNVTADTGSAVAAVLQDVLRIFGGANGIDTTITSDGNITVSFDATEVGADTWTDAQVSNTLTASNLVAASGVVSGTEIVDDTITFADVAHTLTLAGNPALAASQCFWASTGIICEGSTANTIEALLTFTNPTSDRTYTFPDASGEVSLLGQTISDAEVDDAITVGNSGTVDADALGCDVGDDDLVSEDCIGDVLDDSEIEDIYLFNSGDAATGNYTFDASTLTIDSTGDSVGVNVSVDDIAATLHVNGTVRFESFQSCNLDTDANGDLVCGTDATGGAGSGNITGSNGANTQLAYFTNGTHIESDAGLTYNAAGDDLTVNDRIAIGSRVEHVGNAGTYMVYTTDNIAFATNSLIMFEIDDASENAVIVNEDSSDFDFRVESNGDANALFVNAGTDRVGIGTNSPGDKLDVAGNVSIQTGNSLILDNATGSAFGCIFFNGSVVIDPSGTLC